MEERRTRSQSDVDELLQFVSFKIGSEEFGVDILKVQDIIRMLPITRVPDTPASMDGIINWRGKILPIMDLRERFGMDRREHDKNSRIMVMELNEKILGFVVDSVNEVLRIPKSVTEPPPSSLTGEKTDYITGVGKLDDRLLILLDMTKVILN